MLTGLSVITTSHDAVRSARRNWKIVFATFPDTCMMPRTYETNKNIFEKLQRTFLEIRTKIGLPPYLVI